VRDLDIPTLLQRMFTRSVDLPEGAVRLPVKGIHLNKSPMVVSNLKTPTPTMAARWNVDMDAAMRHAGIAANLPDMSAIWPQVYELP
jgi:exodeoxyribonuclease-1